MPSDLWGQVIYILTGLGILPVIQLGVTVVIAIMIYRYFTDKG